LAINLKDGRLHENETTITDLYKQLAALDHKVRDLENESATSSDIEDRDIYYNVDTLDYSEDDDSPVQYGSRKPNLATWKATGHANSYYNRMMEHAEREQMQDADSSDSEDESATNKAKRVSIVAESADEHDANQMPQPDEREEEKDHEPANEDFSQDDDGHCSVDDDQYSAGEDDYYSDYSYS
ncbi:hypothetical protein GGF44_006718, partial [Coemansia sp. RSA 1694]